MKRLVTGVIALTTQQPTAVAKPNTPRINESHHTLFSRFSRTSRRCWMLMMMKAATESQSTPWSRWAPPRSVTMTDICPDCTVHQFSMVG